MAFWKKGNEQDTNNPVQVQQQNLTPPRQETQSDAATSRPDPLEEELLRRFGRIRTALSSGTVIQGRLSFDAAVRIEGKLLGHVFSSHILLIGKGAEVAADIEADTIVVLGSLKGNVKARTRIEVFPGAVVEANLTCPSLILQEGAVLQGKCQIKQVTENR